MGVAIAALSSCTQNEVLDIAESNTIQFGKSYIGKPTRATIVENEAMLDNFYVYAHSVNSTPGWGEGPTSPYFMENEKVYRGPNDVWGYDNIKKYENTKLYSFAAYSDGGIEGVDGKLASGVTFTSPTSGTSSAIAKLQIADYTTDGKDKDLLVAISQNPLTETDPKVIFAFKHALSQIKFNIYNPLGNNSIRIESFSVTGFKDKASLTYTEAASDNPIITWAAPTESRTISTLEKNTAVTNDPAYGTYTIIPQTIGESGLTVSITASLILADGTVKEQNKKYEAKLTTLPTFVPGYIYNFNATLNMGYIYFDDITVIPWETADDTEMNPVEQPGA